jgi:hypothetical protein
VWCLRNTFHNFRLLPGAGVTARGLAKMRCRFLRGPRGHLLYGVDGSHFAMYLQVLAQRARVALHFPPILAAPTVLPPRLHVEFFYVIFKTRYLVGSPNQKHTLDGVGGENHRRAARSISTGHKPGIIDRLGNRSWRDTIADRMNFPMKPREPAGQFLLTEAVGCYNQMIKM